MQTMILYHLQPKSTLIWFKNKNNSFKKIKSSSVKIVKTRLIKQEKLNSHLYRGIKF